MRKIYFLKTCDTCKRIIKSLPNTADFIFQDIKEEPISVKQLEEMYALTNSYEVLFSKRAKLYKEMGLKDETLQEKDFKNENFRRFAIGTMLLFSLRVVLGQKL